MGANSRASYANSGALCLGLVKVNAPLGSSRRTRNASAILVRVARALLCVTHGRAPPDGHPSSRIARAPRRRRAAGMRDAGAAVAGAATLRSDRRGHRRSRAAVPAVTRATAAARARRRRQHGGGHGGGAPGSLAGGSARARSSARRHREPGAQRRDDARRDRTAGMPGRPPLRRRPGPRRRQRHPAPDPVAATRVRRRGADGTCAIGRAARAGHHHAQRRPRARVLSAAVVVADAAIAPGARPLRHGVPAPWRPLRQLLSSALVRSLLARVAALFRRRPLPPQLRLLRVRVPGAAGDDAAGALARAPLSVRRSPCARR